ncbi:hypothetical protein [Photobacterium damselae]|uniref:hypothetical protein n=1 Tax=Photobacterium damselae TaxID=38293 RepID=UPI001F45790C|nr:hypothetical protein [Photobacterium damselae]UKA04723.1 hypothetical protein IHC89_21010 [Photobacterium damselae subsp. damselae]
MTQAKPSKTKNTKLNYYDRALLLQIKAYREFKANPNAIKDFNPKFVGLTHRERSFTGMHIVDTAIWADVEWRKNLSKSTWRTYRSALSFYAELMHNKNLLNVVEMNTLKDTLSGYGECLNKSTKTSSQKKKNQQNKDHDLLMEYLKTSKSSFASRLMMWMHVNRMVGLRPCEWKKSSVEAINDRISLVVRNAKATNGRAHGTQRIISLDHISEKNVINIEKFAKYCGQLAEKGEFEGMYEGCRKLLQRSSRKLWGKRLKHITLYSSRHQFSSDLKLNGRTMKDIAYLMGHISTDTATHHYGKKRFGRSRRTPFVDPENTINIKSKFTRFSFGHKKK